jgi:hypothetical protein
LLYCADTADYAAQRILNNTEGKTTCRLRQKILRCLKCKDGHIAETTIVDYRLLFADQGKQTSVFHFRLQLG